MAVLEKIRVKFGLAISIIIALALLSFIIDPSTLQSALSSMSSKYDVGKIAGKSISYTDFQENVDKFTTINEIMTGSTVQSEAQRDQIRDAAWQEFLDKYMFVKYAKDAGIAVGEDEMVDLTTGTNVSPILSQNPAFLDESGNFSKEAVVNFVQSIESDESGQLRIFWNYLQNTIYTQAFYLKYGALYSNSNYANALQLTDDIKANNTTVNFDYVTRAYPYEIDSTVVVESAEIRDYYKKHKEFFRQNASRDIEYVVFEVVPSESDIAAMTQEVESVYDEFSTTDNMKAFLLKNSESQLSNYWYKDGELTTTNSDINEYVFSGKENVTPIVKDGNVFYAARVMAEGMVPDSVFVKHILLQGNDAKSVADSLLSVVKKGGNFSSLAAQYSADQGSAADGQMGSIGWLTQNYMIPGFESVFDVAVGQPFVLDTQYGTHVVLVSDRTRPVAKKRVAILQKTTLASKETFNMHYAEANTFATIAGGTAEGYKKAIDSTHVYSHAMNITEATDTYGAIDQAKEITRWAFDNKVGKASNIITVNNNEFFIVMLKAIHKEGYQPVNEAAINIQAKLYNDKVQEKIFSQTAEQTKGLSGLDEIAEKLGTTVEHREAVSLATTAVDPALVGAAAAAKPGEVFGPVKGILGVYYVNVTEKNEGEFYTEEDARMMATQEAQYAAQLIIPVMSENAEVKDNRERFF